MNCNLMRARRFAQAIQQCLPVLIVACQQLSVVHPLHQQMRPAGGPVAGKRAISHESPLS